MIWDDFLFYLPVFGSFALFGISAVIGWVILRLYREWHRKKQS